MILPLLALMLTWQTGVSPSPQAQAQAVGSRTALATVVDARNRPMVDLGPDDFLVREGTETREILSVHMADYPVVVLIDNGVDTEAEFDQIRKAVARFIERLGERPVALVTIADPPVALTAFGDDRKLLTDRLNALTATPSAARTPLKALAEAARIVQATNALFSSIVVVTSAAGDSSGESAEDFVAAVLSSGAIVHTIENRPPVDAARRPLPEILQGVSNQTHGQFAAIFSPASYQVALDHLVERLGTEMMIEYVVPARSDGSDVRIGVRVPGARVKGLGVAPK